MCNKNEIFYLVVEKIRCTQHYHQVAKDSFKNKIFLVKNIFICYKYTYIVALITILFLVYSILSRCFRVNSNFKKEFFKFFFF